jgi:tetratricopeptide (TPR) repeat protein
VSRESLRVIARDPSLTVLPATLGMRELNTYTQIGYGVDQAIDVVLSNANPVVEGNAQDGYVVRGHNRSDQEDAFVVVEGGKARLLATSKSYPLAGPGALARANAGLNDAALSVLNWAAKFANSSSGGDPLGTSPLTHFWPIPKDEGAKSIQYAAAALAASLGDPDAVPVLVTGRSTAASHARQLDFDIALAADYFAQKDLKDLAPVAERLASAYPDSVSGFKYRTAAYRGLQDWQKADAVVVDWLTQHKNDPDGIMARAFNATYQGKSHEARAMLAPLVAAGTATTSMSNQFAWLSVATNEVDESVVQAAREVSNDFARRNAKTFSVNHTLACVYALSGRLKEALDVLTKAMDTAGMAAPDSATWFAQGLIAEAYGDVQSAALYYRRVQADPIRDADPVSTYNLAQRRLEKLSSSHK